MDAQSFLEAAGTSTCIPWSPRPFPMSPASGLPGVGADPEEVEKKDLMSVFFNFIRNLLSETIFKSGRSCDPKAAKEDSPQYERPATPSPAKLNECDRPGVLCRAHQDGG